MAIGPSGVIYVGDVLNHVIRMISGSVVSTVAGVAGQGGFEDGKPGQLDQPVGLAMGPNQTLYFADRGDQASAIRKLALGSGTLSTVAGNGRPGFFNNDMLHTQFRNPYAVAVAPDGWIYVADPENRRVRAISPTGTSSTVCGNGESGDTDGSAGAARLGLPLGLAFLPSGELLVLDATKRKIRKIQGTLHLSAPIWPQWAVQRLAVRPQWKRITIPSIDPTAPRR